MKMRWGTSYITFIIDRYNSKRLELSGKRKKFLDIPVMVS